MKRGGLRRWLRKSLSSVYSASAWWWPWSVQETSVGAWQTNSINFEQRDSLLKNSAVYCCVTGIASDVAKLRIKLTQIQDGIWRETASPSYSPVLRRPNHYQNRIQFLTQWITSKLLFGATYVIKQRDNRGVVTALYVLDPQRVVPKVAETGDVFYEMHADALSHVGQEQPIVPAREIIHDLMNPLWHPLIGVSPLYACSLSAALGTTIQTDSRNFFANRSMPGGIITVEGELNEPQAAALKASWQTNYSGDNRGQVAVLADGMKFEALRMTAEAAQLEKQLKWSAADIARSFHYPLWKITGEMPPYASNPAVLTTNYYTDCLQSLIESIELLLDEGLELPNYYGVELDIDNLMRMDIPALFESNSKAVTGGWFTPNEARRRAGLLPVAGGDTPYLQQQNYGLEALLKRDNRDDPFAKSIETEQLRVLLTERSAEPQHVDAESLLREELESGERFAELLAKELELVG